MVVAAGAIPTPPLLRRSGLGRHPRLGRNLSIHPATGITAGFEEEVVPWSGVMQSVGIEELHEREGVLIEATGSPPGMGAISAPGYGTHLLGRLDRAANTGDDRRDDRRRALRPGLRRARPDRLLSLCEGRRNAASLLFESRRWRGRRWLPEPATLELGAGGALLCAPRPSWRRRCSGSTWRRLRLAGFRPSGTVAPARTRRATRSIPRPPARRDGVWVADGSILPSCPGVNPQVSIMAMAIGVGEAAGRP